MMDSLSSSAVRALVDSPYLRDLRLLGVNISQNDNESRDLLQARFRERAKCNGFYEPW